MKLNCVGQKRANEDVREYAKSKGVCFWQIADACGIHDSNFSRLMRYPLDDADRKTIMGIIDDIADRG